MAAGGGWGQAMVVGHLYISEYAQIAQAAMDAIQAPQEPAIGHQCVEIHDDKQAVSQPFDGGTRFVVLWADCDRLPWVSFTPAESPKAVVGLNPLYSTFERGVKPGMRVAVSGERRA